MEWFELLSARISRDSLSGTTSTQKLNISKFSLTLYQTTNFRLVQIESICRRQIECDRIIEIYFWKGRKHCGKRRKFWLPAFSPFPTMFSKGLFLKVVKSRDCVEIVKPLPHNTDFLMTLRNKTFKNIAGKGENAGYHHFLLFPQCFLF